MFAAEAAEACELHAMFAWFCDEDGGRFSGSAVRDGVAYFEVPSGYLAFDGGIPGSEPKFCFGIGWDARLVHERIGKETGSAFDLVGRVDFVSCDLDGIW